MTAEATSASRSREEEGGLFDSISRPKRPSDPTHYINRGGFSTGCLGFVTGRSVCSGRWASCQSRKSSGDSKRRLPRGLLFKHWNLPLIVGSAPLTSGRSDHGQHG